MIKLWRPSGGYYMLWTGIVYTIVGAADVFWLHFCPVEYLSMVWSIILSLPLVIPPLGRYLNMTPLWTRKEPVMSDNVYSLPDVSRPTRPAPPPMPPSKEDEHYRVGVTSDGRTTLTFLGSSGATMTLTMGRGAVEQMIRLLEATFDDEK